MTVGPVAGTLIPAGSTWFYRANAAAPPANWTQPDFVETGWLSGPTQLGYGDGDEARTFTAAGLLAQRIPSAWPGRPPRRGPTP